MKLKKVKNVDKLIFVFLLLLVYGIFAVVNTGVSVDEFNAKINFVWIAVCALACFVLILYRREVEKALISDGAERLKRNVFGVLVVSAIEAFLYLVLILMLVVAVAVFFELAEPVNIFVFWFTYLWVALFGVWVITFVVKLGKDLYRQKIH